MDGEKFNIGSVWLWEKKTVKADLKTCHCWEEEKIKGSTLYVLGNSVEIAGK